MKRGRVSADLLQKIKDAVNLIEVVGEHVVLRKTGSNHVGLCPFHSERTPSFSVSENKQLYHCYGCKRGGDLVSFVMEVHGISFPEAIEELADRAQVQLPKDFDSGSGDPEVEKKRKTERDKLALAYKLNRFVAAYYHQMLAQTPSARDYLRKRGVSETLERAFYAGVAGDSWESLAQHVIAKKAPAALAVELGLIRPSTKGQSSGSSGYFDLFRNRVMFPILNMRGKVAGFGGRTLPGDARAGDPGPKYMNSPESLIFQKSKLAFGMYQAQKHIREKDELILVEGYFDVLALHAAGFQNVVSTCGTALTLDHLNLFKRFANRIVILFDGDKAGVAATERAMEIGLEQGLVLYGAAMPEGLDPDEVLFDSKTGQPLTEGVQKMQSILTASQPLLDQRIEDAIRFSLQGSEQKTQALKRVAGWLGRFRDPVGRELRIEAFLSKTGITRQLFGQALGQSPAPRGSKGSLSSQPTRAPSPANRPQGRSVQAKGQSKLTRGEQILLGVLTQGGEFANQLAEARSNLPPKTSISDLFEYPPAREFVSRLFEIPGALEEFRSCPDRVLEGDLDPQVRSTVTEALVSSENPISREDFKLVLERGLARIWARFSQRIKGAIAAAEASKDAGLQSQLMKEYLDVQRKMKEFISFYDEA